MIKKVTCEHRKLKIYKRKQLRAGRTISVAEIRLQGRWIEKYGFRSGRIIQLEQTEGQLILTLVE